MRKVPNTIWTRAENGQNPSQKTLSRYLWNPQKHLFGLAKSGLGPPLPKASNSKTQAQSLAQQNTLQNCRKISLEQQNTSPKASNSKTRSGLGALDPKSPKHHLDTSRKRPKPQPKNSFTLSLESTKTSFGPREIWPWNTAPESREQQNTSPKASQNPSQKTLSRYLWNPQKHLLGLAKSRLEA